LLPNPQSLAQQSELLLEGDHPVNFRESPLQNGTEIQGVGTFGKLEMPTVPQKIQFVAEFVKLRESRCLFLQDGDVMLAEQQAHASRGAAEEEEVRIGVVLGAGCPWVRVKHHFRTPREGTCGTAVSGVLYFPAFHVNLPGILDILGVFKMPVDCPQHHLGE